MWIWLDILMTSEANHGGSFVQYAFNFGSGIYMVCCAMLVGWVLIVSLFFLMLSQFSSIRDINSAWWHHKMETFSALLVIYAGNSPVSGEFPSQRPVTRSFDLFFDLRLNKPLSKQWWGWWFETLSRLLWRHCNGKISSGDLRRYRAYYDVIVMVR